MTIRAVWLARVALLWTVAAAMARSVPAPRDIGLIDAHVHFYLDHPALREHIERMDLRFVNVTVLDPYEGGYETLAPQHQALRAIALAGGGRAPWVASFDPRDFEAPGFSTRVIAELDQAFSQGAVGVKMYKTFGMDLRRKNGEYVMPDDPAFDDVLEAIAARGKTLYAHIAEPAGAWKPLDASDPDYAYYKNNPRWHISGQPDRPSKAAILLARDRMLGKHPKLRVVGCHLGSMEEDVSELAARLDRFPNFVVDTAARVPHLARQQRGKLRKFLLKYQDRVLYATDDSILPGADVAARVNGWQKHIENDWRFFAGGDTLEYGGGKVKGLALPEGALKKIFRENAVKWVLGEGRVR